jgi:hypothetical protein
LFSIDKPSHDLTKQSNEVTMNTSLASVALVPRALDESELDLVAAAGGKVASFGGMVGWVLGEGVAIGLSFLTANPGPPIAYQLLTASAGVAIGAVVGDD